MYRTENINDCNFDKRDFACIVFNSRGQKLDVLSFLKEHDEFEHDYCVDACFAVNDLKHFETEAEYIGKYEPDLEAMLKFCNKSNIKFVVYNETKGVYFTNNDVNKEYDIYETLEEFYNQVTSIRGIDIEEDYCPDICRKVKTILEKHKNN